MAAYTELEETVQVMQILIADGSRSLIERFFIVSALDFSVSSATCCSPSWLSIMSCCAFGNCRIVKKSEYLSLLLKNPD